MNTFAAILSGLLLTVIFPTVFNGMHLPDLSVLAWVSLVPLVLVCRRKSLPKVAFFSFVTGLTYNALVSYWIFFAMHKYGGLPAAASIGGVLSMASILAFMLAIVFVFVFWLDKKRLVPLVIALPVFWTLYEWVRNYGPFGGYPWSQLAYSQAHHLSLIQAADLFGIYGITFLIVLVNLAIVELAESIPVHRRPLVVPILMAALLLGANTAYGLWRLQDIQKQTKNLESLTIGLAQPNIPQEIKWSPGQAKKSLNILFGLTKQAVAEGADLVIWPESGYQDILATNLEEIYEMALGEASILTGVITVCLPEPRHKK